MAGLMRRRGFRRDILSGERRKARRWWLQPGRLFSGRTGIVVLLGFLAVGGWFAFVEGSGNYRVRGLGLESDEVKRVDHPEAGRPLAGDEVGLALRYGRPLYLGDGGLPVVELKNGVVRELTPVEAEFESVFPYEETGYGGVVWGPGPQGWGMWWKDQSEVQLLMPSRVFPRLLWRDKQERELELGAVVASFGLMLLLYVDFEVWQRGVGEPLVMVMAKYKERHPVLEVEHWAGVPGQWVCDGGLESDLTQGVSQGCPGPEYDALLKESWVRLGAVVEVLHGIGRLIVFMDGMSSRELYDSEARSSLAFYFLDLDREWTAMEAAFEDMREGTAWYGLPVDVEFFDPDW